MVELPVYGPRLLYPELREPPRVLQPVPILCGDTGFGNRPPPPAGFGNSGLFTKPVPPAGFGIRPLPPPLPRPLLELLETVLVCSPLRVECTAPKLSVMVEYLVEGGAHVTGVRWMVERVFLAGAVSLVSSKRSIESRSTEPRMTSWDIGKSSGFPINQHIHLSRVIYIARYICHIMSHYVILCDVKSQENIKMSTHQ